MRAPGAQPRTLPPSQLPPSTFRECVFISLPEILISHVKIESPPTCLVLFFFSLSREGEPAK